MTHHVASMLEAHPQGPGTLDRQRLAECIQACLQCAQACTTCADACLAEEMVADLRECIRTNLDCADVCATTGAVLSRQTGNNVEVTRALLEACRIACRTCGDECAGHADMHEHCRTCAAMCRRCEQACADLLATLG